MFFIVNRKKGIYAKPACRNLPSYSRKTAVHEVCAEELYDIPKLNYRPYKATIPF